jgi:menaquinone-dependent protoporphyrinogen oxidase
MRPVLLLYSSSEGQVRKVAAHVIEYLTLRSKEARIDDVEGPIESVNAAGYRGVVLVASVHLGPETSQMISFVQKHRNELERLPTALLALSLAAGSAEVERQAHSRHARSSAEVAVATKEFLGRTGFAPSRILPVAGALLYTRQGQFVRFVMQHIARDSGVMQRIARDSGLDPDGDRDFERSAWNRVDCFVDEFLNLRPALPTRRAAAG